MTLREHVYAVKNLLASGPPPDDFRYSNALIAHYLEITRGLLIERKADKYIPLSPQSFQSWCVDLIKASYHNCCETPASTCQLLRSTNKIPKFLTTRFGDLSKITDLNGNPLSKTTPTMQRLSEFSITNRDPKPGYFIHDNYLYIVANTSLAKVLMNNVFLTPSEVENYNCPASDTTCPDPLDVDFPIDADLIAPMYEMSIKFLSLTSPQDYENDARTPDTN